MESYVKGDYMLVYKGGGMPTTEKEKQAVMAAWGQWYGALGKAVVDPGNPFGPSRSIAKDGAVKDSTSGFTGYTILKAENLEVATKLAKGCPVLTSGGAVEVY